MNARRRAGEAGYTLVEVIIAAVILTVAFAALATVFINGQSQASASTQESQLINVADQQIESVRAQVAVEGFTSLAVNYSATPAFAAGSPNAFVTGSCYEIASNYDGVNTQGVPSAPTVIPPSSFTAWSACPNTTSEPLEVVPGSSALIGGTSASCASASSMPVLSSPCTATVGNATFTVYTYVTDTFVGCSATGNVACPTTTGTAPSLTVSSCSGAPSSTSGTFSTTASASVPCADARRVTVAVVPAANQVANRTARITPVYVSAIFTNPTPSTSSSGPSVGLTLGLGI